MEDNTFNNQTNWALYDEYYEEEIIEEALLEGLSPSRPSNTAPQLLDQKNSGLEESVHPFDERTWESLLASDEEKTEIESSSSQRADPLGRSIVDNHGLMSSRQPVSLAQEIPEGNLLPEEHPTLPRPIQQPHTLPEEQPSSLRKSIRPSTVKRPQELQNHSLHDGAYPSERDSSILEIDDLHCFVEPRQTNVGTTEKVKRENPWGARELLLLSLFLVLLTITVAPVLFFRVHKNGADSVEIPPTFSSNDTTSPYSTTTINRPTPFDPYNPNACDILFYQEQPHVISQCACFGHILLLAGDTMLRYDRLKTDILVPQLFGSWNHQAHSCHPANQALVWLSADITEHYADLQQRYIMAYMYFATDGAAWNSQGKWITDHPVCDWHGVGCTQQKEIVKISLTRNELRGTVPSELGYLTRLRVLAFQGNLLSGSLHSELFSLSDLSILDFSQNRLSGSLPTEVGMLANLEMLGLHGNRLKGMIPKDLSEATQLQVVDLGQNNFFGELPNFRRLTKLSFLSFQDNPLILGDIPTGMSWLTSLTHLSLSRTSIRRGIEIIENMTSLKYLDLSGCRFKESIPSIIGGLSNLTQLSLQNNSFVGSIPTNMGSLTKLTVLRLDHNKLTSSLPSELGRLTALETMTLEGNAQLTGRSPDKVCSLRSLALQVFTTDCPTSSDDNTEEILGISCRIPSCCSACFSRKI